MVFHAGINTVGLNQYPYNNGFNNYYHNYNLNYRNHYNWGNPYTAYGYARSWYPGWNPYGYGFYNNRYYVYMKSGYTYRTVIVGPNYGCLGYHNGLYAVPYGAGNINGGYNIPGSIY